MNATLKDEIIIPAQINRTLKIFQYQDQSDFEIFVTEHNSTDATTNTIIDYGDTRWGCGTKAAQAGNGNSLAAMLTANLMPSPRNGLGISG